MKIKYIVALMTVIATAGGCTQDTGEQPEEAVPIRLAATITPTDVGKTRAFGVWGGSATTQDTELLTGQTVRAWISENDGSHTDPIKDPIEYTVSNAAGDLEPVNTTTDPAFYYPQGVDVISIHAIHPSGYASGGTFTVNTDQTTEANYAASDLCYSMPANFARTDVDANGRKLLQMKHLLSKIVVNLTLDPNVTSATLPASIKLHAKTSTTMTYPVDPSIDANCYTGCTASDASNPGIITMIQEAIIPPQTIAAGASFLSFSVTGVGPMIYPMPAATTFESGKRYIYDISVKNVGIDVTTTVAGWGTDGVVRPPVRAKKWTYENVQIGDVVNDDGTITPKANAPDYSKTPIGVVVYLAQSDNDPICEGLHALVMAVKESGTDYVWGPSGDNEDPEYFPHISSLADARAEPHTGLEKTLFALADGHSHPAFEAARNHTADCSQVIGSTGWFLPNLLQLVTAAASIKGNTLESTTWETWQYNDKSMHVAFENFLSKAGTDRYTRFPNTTGSSKNHTIISSSIGRADNSDPKYPSNKDFGTWIHFDGRSDLGIDIQTYSGTPRTEPSFCVFPFFAF